MTAPDPRLDEAAVRLGVVVEAPQHSGLWGVLDYLSAVPLPPGTLVRVPLGRRVVTGVVWTLPSASGEAPAMAVEDLKAVIEVLEGLPALPPAWRQLVGFAAAYYQRSLGEMALMVLPPELRQVDAVQLQRRLKRLDKALASPEEHRAEATLPELSAWARAARGLSCCGAAPGAARPRFTCARRSVHSTPANRC